MLSINQKSVEIITASVKANIPLLLIGETGTGKTTLIKQVAESMSKKLYRINLNGETGTDELLGKYLLKQEAGKTDTETVWIDGPMLTAIKEGHWLLLDEINAALPEVLFTIQALAESNNGKLGSIAIPEKEGEVIEPHPDFRLFATANPASGRYGGTKEFNAATISRFGVIYVECLSQAQEKELLESKFPKTSKDTIHSITSSVLTLRKRKDSGVIDHFVSTRDLVMMCSMIESGLSIENVIDVCIVNKVQEEGTKQKLIDFFKKEIPTYKGGASKKYQTEVEELKSKIKELSKAPTLSKEHTDLITELTSKVNELNVKLAELQKKEESYEKMKTTLKSVGLF